MKRVTIEAVAALVRHMDAGSWPEHERPVLRALFLAARPVVEEFEHDRECERLGCTRESPYSLARLEKTNE